MKPFPIVTLLCFPVLFAVASAQEPSAEQLQRQIEEQLRFLQTPKKQLEWEADQLAANRSSWNGQGTWMPLRLMMRTGADDELGLTDEQKQRLSFLYKPNEIGVEWFQKMHKNPTPEYTQAMMTIAATEVPGDPFFERATEEQKNAYREATTAHLNLFMTALQTEVQETLTPEQMLQVRKLEMQVMPELGIPFPSMFDPLDLTDEQKKEMNKITGELKAEFDRLTMEAAVLTAERASSTYKTLQEKSFASREEFQTALREVHRQFVPSEEMRKKSNDLQERGTKFVTLLQARLMNVLTDEQLVKMQEIIDATPEFARKLIAGLKAQREAAKKSPIYVPGPDSWRPGDPLPEKFKEERKAGRFPRSE